jgi:hypothetical protein
MTEKKHELSNVEYLKSVFWPGSYGLSGSILDLLPTSLLHVTGSPHEPIQCDARIHFEIVSWSDGVINSMGAVKLAGRRVYLTGLKQR